MGKKLMLAVVGAFIGMGCGMLASCGDNEAISSGSDSQSNVILVENNRYDPVGKTVSVGTTVEWRWQGDIDHSVTSGAPGNPDGTFDSGIQSSGSFSRTFASAGTFLYYCRVHGASASMMGTISVTADTGGGYDGGYGGGYGGG